MNNECIYHLNSHSKTVPHNFADAYFKYSESEHLLFNNFSVIRTVRNSHLNTTFLINDIDSFFESCLNPLLFLANQMLQLSVMITKRMLWVDSASCGWKCQLFSIKNIFLHNILQMIIKTVNQASSVAIVNLFPLWKELPNLHGPENRPWCCDANEAFRISKRE